ncbi:hypothetical protein DBR43_12825 [Pedobacter sp. KBW06]|uniref:hypothetical protein n=1 Tax=Pedobacter sp. KBW06 TaxID=2153359 RepID=UPI000F594A8A|nr:hypothetical protein [Pedobacter sp. KBW06]RQO72097.1 hypothetical protein DBR43_12825 [Pedobacter sp. KBW06]
MKRIYKLSLIASFCLIGITAQAQKAQIKYTVTPGVFTPEDEVVLEIDLAGSSLAGKEPYIWAFGPGDAITNTSWTSSPDIAKFTKVADDKWKYIFVGTTFYNKGASDIIGKPFSFLVKTKDGGIQSEDYTPTKFSPILFVPTLFRNFPLRTSQYDALSLYLDQRYTASPNNQRFSPTSINIRILDAAGQLVGQEKKGLPIVKQKDGSFGYTFLPEILFGIPEGKIVNKAVYSFTGTVKDVNGATVPYTTEEAEVVFLDLK